MPELLGEDSERLKLPVVLPSRDRVRSVGFAGELATPMYATGKQSISTLTMRTVEANDLADPALKRLSTRLVRKMVSLVGLTTHVQENQGREPKSRFPCVLVLLQPV